MNPSRPPEIALKTWSGFGLLRPAEPAAPSLAVHELDDISQQTWRTGHFWKRPNAVADALGCYFLRDIALWSPGVATHCGLFLSDNSVPGQMALAQAGGNASATNPAIPVRYIDQPALLIGGAGYAIWGHWIAEFLPSLAIARATMGERFSECVIPLPWDTPDWAIELMVATCRIRRDAVIRYRPGQEYLYLTQAVRPSFGFSGEYTFHSFVREFYDSLRGDLSKPKRRVCISRASAGYANTRPFPLREKFEAIARDHGFEVIRPEALSVPGQIELFGAAAIVIGEYGSAMHNAVFSEPGTVVGCIGHWNSIQMRLGELFRHKQVYLTRGCVWPNGKQPMRLDVTESDLMSFIHRVVSLG